MKKIIITFLFILSHITYSDVYTRIGNENIRGLVINLAEGERFTNLRRLYENPSQSWNGISLHCYIEYGDMRYAETINDSAVYGPCVIDFNISLNSEIEVLVYEIINLNNTDDSSSSDSKYSVSLNDDGTRLAIGEKNGTNSVARVYEYNDNTDAWEQLGDSVE